ncbi:MAG: methionyl-tRNA formyltransferase [Caldilineaceae bacterium]
MRIVFLGTPAFAVPSLTALAAAIAQGAAWQLVGVVTQPDRPAGRGRNLEAPPIKEAASDLGLPVLQPSTLRKGTDEGDAAVETLRAWAPDLLVVAAYGLILAPRVLSLPTFGCLNVHASLLPAGRGASPITQVLLEGAREAGVSLMLMDPGMDTGPVLVQARLAVAPADTTESLGERLAELGAQLMVSSLPGWLAGTVAPVPQSDLPGEPTTCRMIRKEDGAIDWALGAVQIERLTRAYTPWPGAYTQWQGQPLRLHRASVLDGMLEPGRVARLGGALVVGTGAGLLQLIEVQPAGKRAMAAADFANGAPGFVGALLGVGGRGSA